MFDYKIDTKMLPNVYITWASTKGGAFDKRYWLNCKTGEKKDTPEKWMYYPDESAITSTGWRVENRIGISYITERNHNIWVKSGSSVKYAYVKYHKDIDMLEVAAVGIDTTRKPEIHEWKYLGNRFFIDRNKKVVNQNGNVPNRYDLHSTCYAWDVPNMLSALSRLNTRDEFINEFKKFIGADYFTIGNGRCIKIEYLWHIQEWYKTVQKARGKGKEQALVDTLTSIVLSDASDFGTKYPIAKFHNGRYEQTINGVTYFEKVNDDWNVLRIFDRADVDKLDETYRIYINKSGRLRCASYGPTGWITSNIPAFRWGHYSRLVNKDEAFKVCPLIKYAAESLKDRGEERIVDDLITALRYPEIEQISKLGCNRVVDSMLSDSYPKARLKEWFGNYYNEKEKNILRKIGMTKDQLEYYMLQFEGNDWRKNPRGALIEMRSIFGDDLRHVDIESYKKYLTGMSYIRGTFWRSISSYADELHFDAARFTKNLIRIGEKNPSIYNTAHDAMNVARSLQHGTIPEVDWYFDGYSDAVRVHDALVAIKNRQDAERRARWDKDQAERLKKEEEKRIKIDEERKKYEYEDDNYIIRLPKNSNEIISEGSTQRICIGSYTSKHACGDTNLFFLRKKSDPDSPFYAIEMKHDNIVQIHGFGNRWLGNNPEAIPTVIRWLRKHNINCSKEILTCTSIGYSSSRNYVAMPVVD